MTWNSKQASQIIKLAQYLTSLTIQQEIWAEAGKALISFFNVDLCGFGERTLGGQISVQHWLFADSSMANQDLEQAIESPQSATPQLRTIGSDIHALVAETFETGFLAQQLFHTPAPFALAFLPITSENEVMAVMLIGHHSSESIPKEMLDVYLAVAGLVGTTATRLASEQELRQHRQHLTELVQARTAELTQANQQLQQEMTQRKRNEAIMQARLRLLTFAQTHTLLDLLRATVDEAEALTGSGIGFYHFLEADQKTLSLQNWSTRTVCESCKALGEGEHYPIDQAGVWIDCIHSRRAIVYNDYASLPHRKGLPPGHAPVVRLLEIPILRGDQIVAILGVGNKPTDYEEADVKSISALADISWDIVENKRVENALHESEEQLRNVIAHNLDGMVVVDQAGVMRFGNPAAAELLHHPLADLIGQPFGLPLSHADSTEIDLAQPDGETRTVDMRVSAIQWQHTPAFLVSLRDTTERKQTEEALRQRNVQVEALRQLGLEFTADLNVESLLHSITHRALELVGGTTCSCYIYNPELDQLERLAIDGPTLVHNRSTRQRGEGLIGQVWETGQPLLVNDYNAWDTRKQYAQYPTRAVLGVPITWGHEFLGVLDIVADRPKTYIQADVEKMSLLASHAALAIRNAQLYQHAQQEIVERQKLEHAERAQRLLAETANHELAESLVREQQLARTDSLTGIGNRLLFFELAEHEFQVAARYQHPLSIILLDLDHFKQVNDAFGHTVGDRALMQVARALQAQLRTSDVLARHGGEEFIALLPDTDAASAGMLAERIRERIAALVMETAQGKVQLTVSIGVTTIEPNDPSLDAMIQRADEAMYRAKETGRNQVVIAGKA